MNTPFTLEIVDNAGNDWQEVVDFTRALLLLDAAQQCGLVYGGPTINVTRCQEFAEGRRRGVVPQSDAEPCLPWIN